MSFISNILEDVNDLGHIWRRANIEPALTGLPTMIHLYQGQLRPSPRLQVKIAPGRPNYSNTVGVGIHDPTILKGRKSLVTQFRNSAHYSKVVQFISMNKESLLLHARGDISDDELRRRLKRLWL